MKKFVVFLLGLFTVPFLILLLLRPTMGFYDYIKADMDLFRIPLIKPYEIHSTDGDAWGIMYDSPLLAKGIATGMSVDSLGVGPNTIVLYSPHLATKDTMSQTWYVFEVPTRTGHRFYEKATYQAYLNDKLGIPSLRLYSPDSIFKDFQDKQVLPPEWKPHIDQDKK